MYELIILSLLMRAPFNGYLIVKVANDQIGPWAKISSGSLYPLLGRMERQGLITTTSGNCVTSETGAKSLIGSYGGCLCMAGTAACPGPANRNV